MTFTHLQIRSGYSFFNSTITIDKLIKQAKKINLQALSLTDEGVLHGAIPFYQACIKHGIRPILGLTIDIVLSEEVRLPVVLLAKDNTGYQHLIQLSTEQQLNGTCPVDFLQQHAQQLFCIVPTETPIMKERLLQQQFDLLRQLLQPIQQIFDAADLYVGVEVYDLREHEAIFNACRAFHQASGINMVAHQDVRYLEKQDWSSFDCLQAMKQDRKWNPNEASGLHMDHYLRTEQEMGGIFTDWQEPLENIAHIVTSCHVTFDFEQQLLPAFPVPNGETAETYLRTWCEKNIALKYAHKSEEVTKRLNDELHIIKQLAFSDYFLIVADFVEFAKKNGIVVGPGRGSAAGSIVAYLLGITNVDPLQYNLLFERFLNPERVTMPDIDIDFSDVRRDEVIEYVREKYGQDHVAQIITFGTFAARSLLRELMKTMDIDYRDQAYILKHIPVQSSAPLLSLIQASDTFQAYIKQSKVLSTLFSIALKLEGLPRHISTHAAGIVIGKQPLIKDVPLTKGSNQAYLTQYAMHELEAIGLLKIDVLGLRNLSLMERIVHSINRAKKLQLDVDYFPENDEKTFQLLQAGKTNGIFQLESAGMKKVLTELLPSSLEDIIALNALYRPGPMEQIPTYIKRKHGKEKVTYLHPKLIPILESTYGVLIYQEQIMQVAQRFAGLTLGQADILRRAISKKNHQLIAEQKTAFIEGCKNQGYAIDIANEIFAWILKFANYGFNKSHSVAYSKIAYQLSYLKAHYPTYFFAHLLGTAVNDSSKLHLYVREANELGMKILPPSINESYAYFTVENGDIRIGLMAIKGIGYETVKEIIEKRKTGRFADLFEFCLRVNLKRNALETLVLAGAFDETYANRASLLASIDQAYARAELFGDQGDLFTEEMKMKPAYTEMNDFSQMQKLADEKMLLQMYVTDHPIKQYRKELTLQDYLSVQKAKGLSAHRKVKVIAIVQQMKKIHTKRGDSMAFMMMSDETGEMDSVIFPALYREVNPFLQEGSTVCVEGKVSIRENKRQLIVDQIYPFEMDQLKEQQTRFLYIKVIKNKDDHDALQFIQQTARKHAGTIAIIIYNETDEKSYKLGNRYNIEANEQCINELKEYFGSENVVFKV